MLFFQKGFFLLCISISLWFTPGKESHCLVNIYWSQNIQHNNFFWWSATSTISMRICPVIQRCIYPTQQITSLFSYQLLARLVWADIRELLSRCYQYSLWWLFVLKALHDGISKISIPVNIFPSFHQLSIEREVEEKKNQSTMLQDLPLWQCYRSQHGLISETQKEGTLRAQTCFSSEEVVEELRNIILAIVC